MRVGIFTNNYLPRVSGVAHSIENFRKGLESLGHRVYIFAPKYHSNHDEENVFRYRSLRVPHQLGNEEFSIPPLPITRSYKHKQTIKDLNLDLIHSHHPYLLGKTALRYAQRLNIPLVFTNHTPYHKHSERLPQGFEEYFKDYLLSIVKDYAQKAHAVTVPTHPMKEILVQAGVEVPIHIVPSGLKVKDFFNAKRGSPIREKYSIPQDGFLLLVVSRLFYEKNVDFLLEVFRFVQKKDPNTYLMVVGEGPRRRALERTAHSLGINQKTTFTGQVEYAKLPPYYKASDVFVYSSLFDSQGLVVAEAFAAGLPVVALRRSLGPRAIISHKKTGLLVEQSPQKFARAVLLLKERPQLRKALSERALQEAWKYSIAKTTEKLIGIYEKVLRDTNHR